MLALDCRARRPTLINMDRARELQLGDRIAALIADGPAPAQAPAVDVDTGVYTDPARHEREVAAIGKHPVAAIASSEIAEPGDFITMHLAGVPVIITRDVDGSATAMHNACAHRGMTVEDRERGSARLFSCPFHGWSYRLDGSLRAVSDKQLFSNEPCDRGLTVLPTEERHGVVWVTPASNGEPTTSVADWLGTGMDQLLADLGMGRMVHHVVEERELNCNWKLLTDGFMELYHLKYLHRSTIAPHFPANLTLSETHGPHVTTWIPKNRLLSHMNETDRDDWQILRRMTATAVLVPGTVIEWQAGHIELFSLRPHATEPNRTTARLTMLVPADRAHERELWDRNWERVIDTVPGEDFAAAESVQANIDAGVVARIQLGDNERMLLHHLEAVQQLL